MTTIDDIEKEEMYEDNLEKPRAKHIDHVRVKMIRLNDLKQMAIDWSQEDIREFVDKIYLEYLKLSGKDTLWDFGEYCIKQFLNDKFRTLN